MVFQVFQVVCLAVSAHGYVQSHKGGGCDLLSVQLTTCSESVFCLLINLLPILLAIWNCFSIGEVLSDEIGGNEGKEELLP